MGVPCPASAFMWVSYIFASLLAALVGFGELVGRYRDAPLDVARRLPAIVYMLLHAAAGVTALVFIDAFGWTFGAPGDAVRLVQIMAAGLAAMAILRSALFTVRVGDVDVDAGPSGLLKAILNAVDRSVDRGRAQRRSQAVREIMAGVSFEKASQRLTSYCLELMQNVPETEQVEVENRVASLEGSDPDKTSRAQQLGLVLIDVVGEDVLRASVEALGDEIR